MFNSLQFRLPAARVLLFLLIGVALVVLTRYSSDMYYREVTQRLNSPIASYVANEAPLIEQGVVNVRALQTLARLDSNAIEPHWDQFSLAELVSDIAQEFQLTAERKSVSLAIETDGKNCTVYADIRLIERVFENLIENGLRHTPAHGRITISLDGQDDGVRVTVADTGAGIPEAALPHIFDRFCRAVQRCQSSNACHHWRTGRPRRYRTAGSR